MSFSDFREARRSIFGDFRAGISVGVMALPLALAFAIASGVPPERGLYTAIITGFLISFLGGSRVQIGGPTGAYVLLVFTTIQRHGFEGLQIATLISGALLMLMGLVKLGRVMRYVPQPVIAGFTAGIALVILASQLRDFFGLDIESLPPQFLDKCTLFCQEVNGLNPFAVLFATLTTASLFVLSKVVPKVPGAIVLLVATTALAYFFSIPIETIELRFGAIPSPIPPWSPPELSFERVLLLFPDGVALAMLGAIESLLSAAIADRMTGYRHRSNAELFGQGAANIFSALFGGIPATGAIARTSANIRLGATTPLAGMIHAVTLFLLVFFFASIAGKIPLATLAGILVFVAWKMGEFSHLIRIAKAHATDGLILFLTFALTVLVDLTLAVVLGVALSALLLVRKMGRTSRLQFCEDAEGHQLSIDGPLFFSVGEDLKRLDLPPSCENLRIDCEGITLLDSSGALAIKECVERWRRKGVSVSLQKIRSESLPLFLKLGIKPD